ncbi:MAG: hypothetical protein ABI520_12320 [Caldimonas sp.]
MKNHDLDAPISAFRRKILLGLPGGLAVTAPLALVGCGGGDGTDTTSTPPPASVDRAEIEAIVAKLPAVERSAAKVGVTLPAGSGIALSDTTLLSANSNAQVMADGTSVVSLINGAPQMAYLFGSGGKLLLMSIVEPGVRTEVDSRGTAEALVLIACEAALYGPAMEVAVREVLRTHEIVEPVRLAVEAAAARNGIDGGDNALMMAVAAAVAALRAPPVAAHGTGRKRAQGLTMIPDAAQSGLKLTAVADAYNTMVITNSFRRRAYAWVAQVGYYDAAGNWVALPAPLPVKDFYPVKLDSTGPLSFDSLVSIAGDYVAELIKDLGFLADYERGNFVWTPVESKPVALAVAPGTASVAVYRTRAVGVGASAGFAQTAEETAKLKGLLGATLWNDIMLPLIKNFILPIVSARVEKSVSDIAGQLLLAATVDLASLEISGTYFPATVAAMKNGDAKEVLIQFFSEFLTSNTWAKLLETAVQAYQSAGYPVTLQAGIRDASGTLVGLNLLDLGVAAKQITDAMGKFAKIIAVIKAVATLGDYAALAKDWASSSLVDEFATNVSKARVTLTPETLLIDGTAVIAAVTAKIEDLDAGLAPENVFLVWKCAGLYGDLHERGGDGSNIFQTLLTSPVQDYVPNGTQDDPDFPETIEVTAFYRSPTTNARVEVGTATVKVKFKKAFNLAISPADLTVFPTDTDMTVSALFKEKLPVGSTVSWEWSHAANGSIAALPADANPSNSAVKFRSGTSEGSATITVKATIDIPATGTTPPSIVLVDPVSTTFDVKKNLTTLTFEAGGGVFACSDPLACGVTEYTAFIVPRFDKAVLYRAVLSGYAFAGCNRTVTWTSTLADGGGCNFPVTYFPHSSFGQTGAWAVWIGFGGAFSGKCVVTITLKP